MVPTFLPSSSTTRHKLYNGYPVHSSICLSNNPPFKQFASDFSTKFSLLSLFLFLQFQRLSNIHLIFLDIYFLGLLLWTRLLIYFLVFFSFQFSSYFLPFYASSFLDSSSCRFLRCYCYYTNNCPFLSSTRALSADLLVDLFSILWLILFFSGNNTGPDFSVCLMVSFV